MFGWNKKDIKKTETNGKAKNKEQAKERLHLVLMQDRANVSADFLDMMRQEIIDIIKKYVEVDDKDIDIKLTNQPNGDGTVGAPALYASIPFKSIKKEIKEEQYKEEKAKIKAKKEQIQTEVKAQIEEEKKAEKTVKKTTKRTENKTETTDKKKKTTK